MIALKSVGRKFGDVVALHPIDLNLESGRTTALIGPSGCGKSTILRLILRLLETTSGRVEFDGELITPSNVMQLRRRMGYVIQDGGLYPHLTAEQNILLMAHHLKYSSERTRQRLEYLCALTRLPLDVCRRFPGELSGGQRQRVSLMRALMLDPDVLLLDEPMGALDPLVRASLQTDLKEIFQKLGKTVVLVTHDMAEAGYLAEHIVLLRDGRIEQQGTLADLRDRPSERFVVDFMNAQRSLVAL